jgi:hypothetical protein
LARQSTSSSPWHFVEVQPAEGSRRSLIIWFFYFLTAGTYLIADLLAPAFIAKKPRLTDNLSTVVIGVGRNTGVADNQQSANSWSPLVVNDLA